MRATTTAGRRPATRLVLCAMCCPISSAPRSAQEGRRRLSRRRAGRCASPRQRSIPPLYNALIEAGRQAGYPITEDVNGYQQEGFGPWSMTSRNGRRWSAARAYLHPAMARPNLTVETARAGARASCSRASAPSASSTSRAARSRAGARRARGDPLRRLDQFAAAPDALGRRPGATSSRALGIPVVHDCPASGRTCRTISNATCRSRAPSRSRSIRRCSSLGKLTIGLRMAALQAPARAPATTSKPAASSARGAGVEHPDIQYHFFPMAINSDGSQVDGGHGFQAHIGPMRPTSRGWVKLRSADPARQPVRCCFNYMSTAQDRQEIRDGIRLTREIFAQKAFDPFRGRRDRARRRRDRATPRSTPSSAPTRRPPTTPRHLQDGHGRSMAVVDPELGCTGRGAARRRRLDHAERRSAATSTPPRS